MRHEIWLGLVSSKLETNITTTTSSSDTNILWHSRVMAHYVLRLQSNVSRKSEERRWYSRVGESVLIYGKNVYMI